jgi:succinate dehydrogenase flavin-adding protein (antitoxin of CptAB toxin-antitoxin module)
MDGVSSASAVVGIVSLGISVCQGIVSYYSDFKNAREDILRLTSSMEQLTSNLAVPQEAITGSRSLDVSICAVVEKSILSCEERIGRLNQELIKLRHASKARGFREKMMGFANRALYSLKSDTLQKLTTIVGDTLLQLNPALTALQL